MNNNDELKEFQIWCEGYAATGERGTAHKVGTGIGVTFDDAVRDYISKNPDHGIREHFREDYPTEGSYKRRASNWSIWACNLFDNELEARKYFG